MGRILRDEDLDGLPDVPVARRASALSDDEFDALGGDTVPLPAGAEDVNLGNLSRQALSGATFGMDDEIIGGARQLMGTPGAIEEERARKAAFEKSHPYVSFGARGLGAIAGSLLPVSWLARGGAAGKIAKAALPVTDVGKIAGATIPAAMREGAKIGAKGAVWQRFGDSEGGVASRAVNVADNAPSDLLFGAAVGAPFGYLGRGGANIATDLEKAARIGVGPDAAATQALRETMRAGQGRAARDVISQMIPRTQLTSAVLPTHAEQIIMSYGAALKNGASHFDAERAAVAAYQAMSPMTRAGPPVSPRVVAQRARAIVREYSDNFNAKGGPDMIAAERLSGIDRPIQGQVKSLTRQIMNSPGEGLDTAARVLNPRQEGAMQRSRDLITSTMGDTDYTGFTRSLKDTSKYQQGIAYGLAKQYAKPFDIQPAIAKHTAIARKTFGDPGDNLNKAGQQVLDWWQRIPKPSQNTPPQARQEMLADLLNSYKQVRRSIETTRQQLIRDGDRESALYLGKFKRDLDAVVARQNKTWWKANRMAAEDFAIDNAADLGRTISLKEGAELQKAKDWFRGASIPEKEAFKRGLARQMHDKVSAMGDTHDVSKAFLSGSEWDEEGMRGLIRLVLGPKDARRFLSQIEKERTALATFRLDKNSITSSVLQEADKRNRLSGIQEALRYAVNPLGIFEAISNKAAQSAGEARDAALARRLFSTKQSDFFSLLQELQRAEKPSSQHLQDILRRAPESAASVAPGAFGDFDEQR